MNADFLKAITETFSVAGFEGDASRLFEERLNDIATISRDAVGNTYATLQTDANARRVLVEAHIDEIGFAVTYIDPRGFLFIRQIGGIDWAVVSGSKVVVKTVGGELLHGVIGKVPIHVMRSEDSKNAPRPEDLYVDLGLPAETVTGKVTVGDPLGFEPNFSMLSDSVVTSKGLDDKVGVAVMADVLKKIKSDGIQANLCAVATVQEELGAKGARLLGRNVRPDYSISIDVDHATDAEGVPKRKYGDIKLGGGVIISRHADVSQELVNKAINIAKKAGIPFQISAFGRSTGGTDTPVIQTSESGIPTLLLGIPNRYMHTQVEMCDLRDLQAASDLIVELIKELS